MSLAHRVCPAFRFAPARKPELILYIVILSERRFSVLITAYAARLRSMAMSDKHDELVRSLSAKSCLILRSRQGVQHAKPSHMITCSHRGRRSTNIPSDAQAAVWAGLQ